VSVLAQFVARVLLMPVWMIALGILVKGYVDTGDGFSAGVVAALGVLMQYVVFGTAETEKHWLVRRAREYAAAGLLIALTVVFVPAFRDHAIMTHYPRPGDEVLHFGTLEVLTAVLFDVGVFLLVLGFCIAVIDLIAHSTARRRS
jgi:multisubunit Na+/H+ antiporter MnhB subunit